MNFNLRFSNTVEEFAEFCVYTRWYAPFARKQKWNYILRSILYFIAAYVAMHFIFRGLKEGTKNISSFLIIYSLVFLAAFTLAIFRIGPASIKTRARKLILHEENKRYLEERNMYVSDEGIAVSESGGEYSVKWDAIVKFASFKEIFLLYLNSESALIIPQRVFRNPEEVLAFENFIAQKIPLRSSFRALGVS